MAQPLMCQDCNPEARKRKRFLCDGVDTSDGLPVRCVHSQSFLKLEVLDYYLKIFSVAMKSHHKELNFIDLFSGPGLCINRENGEERLGSSLIALTLKNPFTNYIFVDADSKTSDILHKRCERLAPELIERINILNVDANQDVARILKHVNGAKSLSVAFLDPNGLDIHYNTLKLLSQFPKLDVIINFGVSDLKRNLANYSSGKHEKANQFFGCETWPDRDLEWLPFYMDRLKALGFTAVEDDLEQKVKVKTKTKADIYYLIFASKHSLGLKFWREAKHKNLELGLL
ncbi:MAG: three-Cys-motif partner protein TcmP [Candidatus Zixiibacteriota bacterium]